MPLDFASCVTVIILAINHKGPVVSQSQFEMGCIPFMLYIVGIIYESPRLLATFASSQYFAKLN